MATISIPKPIRAGFTKLAEISDDSFRAVISAFENIPLRIRQHIIFDDAELEDQGVSADVVRAVKDAVFPLYSGLATGTVTIPGYVNDITESLREFEQDEGSWVKSEAAVDKFRERLTRLLNVNTLQTVAKAHDVLLEHDQAFSTARVLTDVRPIFGDDVESAPTAAVIVHMLNIAHYGGSDRGQFVVALDTKDIELLIEVLERAKKKTESLKSVIESSGMTYIPIV